MATQQEHYSLLTKKKKTVCTTLKIAHLFGGHFVGDLLTTTTYYYQQQYYMILKDCVCLQFLFTCSVFSGRQVARVQSIPPTTLETNNHIKVTFSSIQCILSAQKLYVSQPIFCKKDFRTQDDTQTNLWKTTAAKPAVCWIDPDAKKCRNTRRFAWQILRGYLL